MRHTIISCSLVLLKTKTYTKKERDASMLTKMNNQKHDFIKHFLTWNAVYLQNHLMLENN